MIELLYLQACQSGGRVEFNFQLTDEERSFLAHWTYERLDPFWGPATIWCMNHRVHAEYAPYAMAEFYWAQETEAGRDGFILERPPIPFQVPWQDAEQFWLRANAALALIPKLQGDLKFTRSYGKRQIEGNLTPEESNYLRAYNQDMVLSGTGQYIDMAHQNGVRDYQLIPFFILLEDLYGSLTTPVIYPWTDFPARYEELFGRRLDAP